MTEDCAGRGRGLALVRAAAAGREARLAPGLTLRILSRPLAGGTST
jgi:hypothetical protein